MKHLCVTKLARRHPEIWSTVWRILKQEAQPIAELLKDKQFTGFAKHFGSEIDLPLDNVPETAQRLLPPDVILNY